MSNLNIKFKISENNDINSFFLLYDQNELSSHKKQLLINNLPLFFESLEREEKKKQIKTFVKEQYQSEQQNINNNLDLIKISWNEKGNNILTLIKKDFPEVNLEVTACVTIWPKFIRDIDKKIITFPYNHGSDNAIYVITHELLHLAFFKYLENNYKAELKKINNQQLYEFSENLNILLLNQKKWLKLLNVKIKLESVNIDMLNKMKKLYDKDENLDLLIKEVLIN